MTTPPDWTNLTVPDHLPFPYGASSCDPSRSPVLPGQRRSFASQVARAAEEDLTYVNAQLTRHAQQRHAPQRTSAQTRRARAHAPAAALWTPEQEQAAQTLQFTLTRAVSDWSARAVTPDWTNRPPAALAAHWTARITDGLSDAQLLAIEQAMERHGPLTHLINDPLADLQQELQSLRDDLNALKWDLNR